MTTKVQVRRTKHIHPHLQVRPPAKVQVRRTRQVRPPKLPQIELRSLVRSEG